MTRSVRNEPGQPANEPGRPLASLRRLFVSLGRDDMAVLALTGLDLDIYQGEVLGVVGESGGGKSTMAKAIVGILPKGADVRGQILFNGKDVLRMSEGELRRHHGEDVAICFQNPRDALSPTRRVGDQLADRLRSHRGYGAEEAGRVALQLLESVGIRSPRQRLRAFPHELSGGMCQRVMIALSLACGPRLLLADEPTTGLDVTLTREILALLRAQATEEGRAVLIISHDLAALAAVCDRIAVLYAGTIVEEGPSQVVVSAPAHPYTRALLDAVPDVSGIPTRAIPGSMPTFRLEPAACPFGPRCDCASPACAAGVPPLLEVGERHKVACFEPRPFRTDDGQLPPDRLPPLPERGSQALPGEVSGMETRP